MSATVSVNGRITCERDAVIPVFDHGFLYGEGIYETMRTYHGRPFLYERHMRRLRNSARMIDLPLPFADEELAAQIRETMVAADLEGCEAYIRVLVSRGIGELTYDPAATPNRRWSSSSSRRSIRRQKPTNKAVRVVIVDVVRNHPDTVNPMIKSNNLLNCALAAQQAIRRGGYEAIMRNYRGELSECTTSNLFIVKNGAALTPPLESGLLPGITREFLFDIGQDVAIPVREQVLRDEDLFSADEAFLTRTTVELVPIVDVDDRTIGDGRPGPVTKKLLDAFRHRAHAI